ncbi:hypothetical protein HNE_3269 [Hyphomonas neptunium ATCC 15444]|uniref:Lipoprotein n=2 Tax=Hyphomonas TaxID=85 RepID=Q0BX51_HYPNA|nr:MULTISPECIES: hypothetical protein [Hyphomonas]ABI78795.1 hypothetical protein HNE_3269 [Hyphomonas neptunium ATCC 15444]KCZ92058.1 hypothetical protein HHI_12534 [Hyphomonas hirschiana VP5]
MKLAILLAATCALAAPAFAQGLAGANCSKAAQLDVSDMEKGGVIIITGPCADAGPAREVIHMARPGEPMATTVVIRRRDAGASQQSAVIKVSDRAGFSGSSQARIIRVGD